MAYFLDSWWSEDILVASRAAISRGNGKWYNQEGTATGKRTDAFSLHAIWPRTDFTYTHAIQVWDWQKLKTKLSAY